ncbi:mechanosensitive ion channel family protein [Chachezhania antarctica]|uniref:mechanosensitive ion channel family protein n=1 Tax=Chachezhania antarctica TaxID=2340860 RepID=UPI000EAB9636|nr:mechanosensitive ion channel domain-containing protein [Chachezhania antarctica]|tara:strand:- start:2345 stop:3184 length:840 start_codon:yes stop_codon:yes gene_type:complete
MEAATENYVAMVAAWVPLILDILKALAVLVIGWIVAAWLAARVQRRMDRMKNVDPTLGKFLSSIVKWFLLLMVIMAVLGVFGIQTTSLVAALGAASLAIGLALQGTLSDLAAGFMLILFRPFVVGQYVEAGGMSGTVKEINLFFTEMATPDNVQIIVPNGKIWGSVITNFSAHKIRRLDLVFGIDYADDIDTAVGIIDTLARADDRIHSDPEPWVRVTNLGDSSVDLTARLWCSADDYWDLKFKLTKEVKEAFDKAGITIPFPHTVAIYKPEGQADAAE